MKKDGEKYMDDYSRLLQAYDESGIQRSVELLNQTLQDSNHTESRAYMTEVEKWNQRVNELEDVRLSLNKEFKHLHLPSVAMLIVVYDFHAHLWRFNTEPDDAAE